jgi:hypothetical protein
MQKARLIVTEAGGPRRGNFEITCYGDHISLCFWSGFRENQIVVQVNRGEIHVNITEETLLEWLKGVFTRNWEEFKNVLLYLVEAGTGRPVRRIMIDKK